MFGGSVPKNFFPAVEKGLRKAPQHGVLAGYPMVGLKATLLDGSYHPVDSNDMAFKMAARLAYQGRHPAGQSGPARADRLLKVIPDAYMGDIIGDLNKRRGRVMGMNPLDDGKQAVEAECPMARAWRLRDRPALHDAGQRLVAKACFDYCAEQIDHLRVDTHRNNLTMQAVIEKSGFQRCGIIYQPDGTDRIAYDRYKR